MIFFWPFLFGYGGWNLIWNIAGAIVLFVTFYLFFRYGIGFFTIKQHSSYNTACEILKRRYASGEITKEEYDQKKKDLGC